MVAFWFDFNFIDGGTINATKNISFFFSLRRAFLNQTSQTLGNCHMDIHIDTDPVCTGSHGVTRHFNVHSYVVFFSCSVQESLQELFSNVRIEVVLIANVILPQ